MSGLGKPPSGAAAEKISFFQQVPACFNTKEPFSVNNRQQILDIAERLYSKARYFARVIPRDRAGQLALAKEMVRKLNSKASPGAHWVWMGVSVNRQFLDNPKLEEQLIEAFLILLNKCIKGEDLPLPIVRLFIKDEPHKLKKLTDGIYRLIWALPAEYQMLHRVYLGESLDSEIEHHEYIPSKVGMSFVRGGAHRTYINLDDGTDRIADSDKSSWDMTVPVSLINLERDLRWRRCMNAEETANVDYGNFKFGFDQCYRTLSQSFVAFSDGTLLFQEEPGMVRSGGLITISGNSAMQVLLKICYCVERFGDFDEVRHKIMAVGDDVIERLHGIDVSDYQGWLTDKGYKVKHIKVGKMSEMEFCSHSFTSFHGTVVVKPTNWLKHRFMLFFKERNQHQFFGMQCFSLAAEYAFNDEVFPQLHEQLRKLEPRLAYSRQRFMNFITGYESKDSVIELKAADRVLLCREPQFESARKRLGLSFQGPKKDDFSVVPENIVKTTDYKRPKPDSFGFLPSRLISNSVVGDALRYGFDKLVDEPLHRLFPTKKDLEDRRVAQLGKNYRKLSGIEESEEMLKKKSKPKTGKPKVFLKQAAMEAKLQMLQKKINEAAPQRLGRSYPKSFTKAGLDMKGGTVSGTTMISENINIDGTVLTNTVGEIIYATQLCPRLIAPGSRFDAFAHLFDQFEFTSVAFSINPMVPNTIDGTIIGGMESDPGDFNFTVGQNIDPISWSEHVNFHTEDVLGKKEIRFPKRGSLKLSPGPKGGYFFNRVPNFGDSQSMSLLSQGILFIAIETPFQTSTGALATAFSLGPLFLHWTVKLREASSEPNVIGGEDHWSAGSGSGTVANPLSWTGVLAVQNTLDTWSAFDTPTRYNSSDNSYSFQLNEGFYEIDLVINWAATGAANPPYNFAAQTPTNISSLTVYTAGPAVSSASTTLSIVIFRLHVKVGGVYELLKAANSATGYTFTSSMCKLFPISQNALTASLRHPDYRVRSAAMTQLSLCSKQDAVAAAVRDELKKQGLEVKEEKKSETLAEQAMRDFRIAHGIRKTQALCEKFGTPAIDFVVEEKLPSVVERVSNVSRIKKLFLDEKRDPDRDSSGISIESRVELSMELSRFCKKMKETLVGGERFLIDEEAEDLLTQPLTEDRLSKFKALWTKPVAFTRV